MMFDARICVFALFTLFFAANMAQSFSDIGGEFQGYVGDIPDENISLFDEKESQKSHENDTIDLNPQDGIQKHEILRRVLYRRPVENQVKLLKMIISTIIFWY